MWWAVTLRPRVMLVMLVVALLLATLWYYLGTRPREVVLVRQLEVAEVSWLHPILFAPDNYVVSYRGCVSGASPRCRVYQSLLEGPFGPFGEYTWKEVKFLDEQDCYFVIKACRGELCGNPVRKECPEGFLDGG